MNDSQGSDFVTQSTDKFYYSPIADLAHMDIAAYGSLVSNTKSIFSTIRQEIKKPTFSGRFTNLLRNASLCISQSLDLVLKMIIETDINIIELKEYINDAVCILQLLLDLIKNIIESITMSCCSIKEFPTITAHIIKTVFVHCKDSESMYGTNLNNVEKQIKDLFKTCHELQLIYLVALEKHYIFDLNEKEEQDILVEALDINLKIGEIVQSLDVKTMAEQWKAYTVICEKYSDILIDKHIYRDCVNILCGMIINNIRIALEENQEKVIVRSLKVSNFTLKILLKICNIFKHAATKDYDSIMELLLYVNLNNEAYLHTMVGKSSQFITLYNNNIINSVNNLISELFYDEKLLQSFCEYNLDHIRRDDKMLGFINLIITTIRLLLQKGGDRLEKLEKHRLVCLIYNFLPDCHIWFNMDLQYNCERLNKHYKWFGLYEQLLTHTVSLMLTMTSHEMNIMERRMLEALLSSDSMSAMFTSNLWTILARMSCRELLLTQVVSLCKIYQKIEKCNICIDCPQIIHLRHTIRRLFEVMANDDKMKIYSMFNIRDDKNLGLWRCLKICNLPNDVQHIAQEFAVKKFQTLLEKLESDEYIDIDIMIKSMHLVGTCSLTQHDVLESSLITAWTKACPQNIIHILKKNSKGTLWYYKYMEALVNLTESVECILHRNSGSLVKVLHIVSSVARVGCRELKLLMINILCKLANIEANDVNKHVPDSILTQTFRELFANNDSIVRNKLFNTLRKYKTDNLYIISSNVVNDDESLSEMWTCFINYGRLQENDSNLKVQLQAAMDLEYRHKCLELDDLKGTGSSGLQKSLSNNFDIDIDILFEPESDEEPACKKTKWNVEDVDEIISRLEMDTKLLCNIKENIFTSNNKKKINNICKKLSIILD